jgi:RNA polymerase sigma factor (TIGR02999 family)
MGPSSRSDGVHPDVRQMLGSGATTARTIHNVERLREPAAHTMTDDASARDTITALLRDDADPEGVLDRLLPVVYGELRTMAHRHLLGERESHTLNTTALVHEAYLKLVDQAWHSAASRAYFFGAASRAMRQILVDHARLRTRKKRGGRQRPVELEEHHLVVDEVAADLLDLDEALDRLTAIVPRAARVVECRFFGGLSVEETAAVLDVSVRTVKRDWILARAWLYREMRGTGVGRSTPE